MSLSRNIIANGVGSAWVALNSVIFVPFYLRILGPESFGLIGVSASLVAMLALLDMGLSPAMNREMSRLAALGEYRKQADTARTLEWTYWLMALVVGSGVALLSNFIAAYWLNPVTLNREEVLHALQIMALMIAVRWPIAVYSGGLNGLQKQVGLNVISSLMATVQGGGALLVISFWASTIEAFFLWQACAALIQVTVLRWFFWRNMTTVVEPRFDREVVRSVWRFAAGVSGIALLATLLTQIDKLILSRMLTLEGFGYYMFATTVAGVVLRLIAPVFTAYYPRLTGWVTRSVISELRRDYQLSSQIVAILILPLSSLLVVFPYEILLTWTSNKELSANTAMLVAVLSLGNALNGLMNMPYALQLAYGNTRLGMQINLASLVFVAPAVYFATVGWGSIGAAWVWVALNVGYLTIGIHMMHSRGLLSDQKSKWYFGSVLGPILGVLIGLLMGYPFVKATTGPMQTVAALVFTGVLATGGAILGAFDIRRVLMFRLREIKK